MKKKTFDLYRCSPLLWAGLEFEDALHFRIEKALKAKDYYRILGTKVLYMNGWTYGWVYEDIVQQYTDSVNAVEWNREFLEEIEEERKNAKDKKRL